MVSPEFIGSCNCVSMAFTTESPNGCLPWQVTMDQLICASFCLHPLLVLLKVSAKDTLWPECPLQTLAVTHQIDILHSLNNPYPFIVVPYIIYPFITVVLSSQVKYTVYSI